MPDHRKLNEKLMNETQEKKSDDVENMERRKTNLVEKIGNSAWNEMRETGQNKLHQLSQSLKFTTNPWLAEQTKDWTKKQ